MTQTFGDRLRVAFTKFGRLCVGIDPHAALLEHWGLADSASGVREFGLRVVDAAAEQVGIVKPQVAFFERHGAAGYLALERVLQEARDAGLLVIADVKRGDIGSSVAAYGQAWLTPSSPLAVDAITVNAYQGLSSLESVMRLAAAVGKGVFVLGATSNPEAKTVQRAILQDSTQADSTVAGAIVQGVIAWNTNSATNNSSAEIGSVGVVIGATVDLAEAGIDKHQKAPTPALPVLAPGFGHQGARISDAAAIYGNLVKGVIPSESRSILSSGPDAVAETIRRHAGETSIND